MIGIVGAIKAKSVSLEEGMTAPLANSSGGEVLIRLRTLPFSGLNTEVLVKIFRFTGYQGLCRTGSTSRRLHNMQVKLQCTALSYSHFREEADRIYEERQSRLEPSRSASCTKTGVREELIEERLPEFIAVAKRYLVLPERLVDQQSIDAGIDAVIIPKRDEVYRDGVLECLRLRQKYSQIPPVRRNDYVGFFSDVRDWLDSHNEDYFQQCPAPLTHLISTTIEFDQVLDIDLLRVLYTCLWSLDIPDLLSADTPTLWSAEIPHKDFDPAFKALEDGNVSERQLAQIAAANDITEFFRKKVLEELEHFCGLIERIATSGTRVERASLIEIFGIIVEFRFRKGYGHERPWLKQVVPYVDALKGLRIKKPETFLEAKFNKKLDTTIEELEYVSSRRTEYE